MCQTLTPTVKLLFLILGRNSVTDFHTTLTVTRKLALLGSLWTTSGQIIRLPGPGDNLFITLHWWIDMEQRSHSSCLVPNKERLSLHELASPGYIVQWYLDNMMAHKHTHSGVLP